MIRYKLMGAKKFAANEPSHQFQANNDVGNFTIGKHKNFKTKFEEVLAPPQRIWVRHQIIYTTCMPVAVIKNSSSSTVWQPSTEHCFSVSITPSTILYTKESVLVDSNWQINSAAVEINFQQAQTIYLNDEVAFHLWPCGAKADKNFDPNFIEQLYVEPDLNLNLQNMHITPLRNWQKHNLEPGQIGQHLSQSVMFYPPHPKVTSLAKFINNGSVTCTLNQGDDTTFSYKSRDFENPSKTAETLDILFERMN